jgi:hypothetical protein
VHHKWCGIGRDSGQWLRRIPLPGVRGDDEAFTDQEWANLRAELEKLQEQLLELETDQLEAFEDVIRAFEQIYNELTDQVPGQAPNQ